MTPTRCLAIGRDSQSFHAFVRYASGGIKWRHGNGSSDIAHIEFRAVKRLDALAVSGRTGRRRPYSSAMNTLLPSFEHAHALRIQARVVGIG